jgi:large subunit ribosomal protein L10
MNRAEKTIIIDSLTEQINNAAHFYITDIESLNAARTTSLRRSCYENNVELVMAKNTLVKKALEQANGDFEQLYTILKGNTTIMFSENATQPAKMIKELRKTGDKPILKGAFVQDGIYIGDNQIDTLVSIKSKEEVIGDIINILQSPIKNVLGALQSAPNTIGGLVKTLQERAEK